MKNPFRQRTPSHEAAPSGAHQHGADHPDWCACSDSEDDRRRIAEFGWLAVTVPAGDHDPWNFHYTAGLTSKGLPELIVYGLLGDVGGDVLNLLASRLVEGETIRDGEPIVDLLEEGYTPQLRTAVRRPDPLGIAEEQYGDRVTVRQLVLPDKNNRMPWHPEFDELWAQPVLYAWAPI